VDVAVLGMGRMGRAIAERLLAGGHGVTVWNRSAGTAGELVSAGAREAPSVADAVMGQDVAITSLANDDAVRTVALHGVRPSIGDSASYADCSTVSPRLSAELARAFPGRFVAMPVLGNPLDVRADRASFLVGGDAAVVDRLGPVLSSLSSDIRPYDSPALASAAKVTSNLLLLSEIVALAESFAVGRAGGLSDDQLRELLGDSPMVPLGIKNRFEGILTGAQDASGSTALGAKDAGLAVEVARAANVDVPEAQAVRQLYERAAASGLGHADIATVSKLYQNVRA
jgi:3-hydroxyisobutyrate dehydrogenase-like beta-hydroxyacid dehydrogenase